MLHAVLGSQVVLHCLLVVSRKVVLSIPFLPFKRLTVLQLPLLSCSFQPPSLPSSQPFRGQILDCGLFGSHLPLFCSISNPFPSSSRARCANVFSAAFPNFSTQCVTSKSICTVFRSISSRMFRIASAVPGSLTISSRVDRRAGSNVGFG